MLRLLDGKVGVEVAVRLLGLFNQVDDLIRPGFQFFIRLPLQRVGHRFQPFGHVAVLKHHAVELPFAFLGGDAEIFNGMALFRTRNLVIQNFFLIRDHRVADQILDGGPEIVLHLAVLQTALSLRFFHLAYLPADADYYFLL